MAQVTLWPRTLATCASLQIKAKEIARAETSVAIASVRSSRSNVKFHRMVPTSGFVTSKGQTNSNE